MGQADGSWPMAQRGIEVDAAADALTDPERDAIVICGPAGVGKTRLAGTCLALATASGRLTARVIASHAAAVLPLGVLAPILPSTLPPDASPAALFDQAREELVALGGADGMVLFVDDAHLLDTSSAVLLTQLLDAGSVFLVATIRDGEALPDAVAAWWRRTRTLRLDLADLDIEATGEILTLALGGLVGRDTIRRLHRASGGNPLLLRELVHQALDGDQLSERSGTWRLTGTVPPSRRLVDLLATRLAALTEPERRVLDQLAVCAPLGRAELADDVAPEALEALERSGLVTVLVEGRRHRLVLGHPIYGEALRADLSVLRRRAILLATAERVEVLGARRREDARRVATWRLDAGSTPDPELLLQAARFARYAHDFAQVERLATILWSGGPSSEVAMLLGEAHYQLGHFHEAEAVLATPVPAGGSSELLVQRAIVRGQNLQDGLDDWQGSLAVVQQAQAVLGPIDDLVAQEGMLWNSVARPQRALDAVANLQPDTARARVLLALVRGEGLCRIGHIEEAIEVAIEGFREHSELVEPVALASPGTHFVIHAFALMDAGRFSESDEMALLGYEGAVELNLPFGQIFMALMLGNSLVQQGRIEEARRWLREGASAAQTHGFGGAEASLLCAMAATDAILGNRSSATAAVTRADGLPPYESLRLNQAIGRAWTAWAEGDPEQARKLLVTSATEAAERRNVGTAAWLWHDAARLGAPHVGPHLAALAAAGDSPLVMARAAHITALEAGDAEDLADASRGFKELGMVLLAAEAASAAADAHRRQGRTLPASEWAGEARLLAERCPGVHTPEIGRAHV